LKAPKRTNSKESSSNIKCFKNIECGAKKQAIRKIFKLDSILSFYNVRHFFHKFKSNVERDFKHY